MRTLGRPSGSTVASATALGSFGSLSLASASQSAKSLNGWADSVKSSLAFVILDISTACRNFADHPAGRISAKETPYGAGRRGASSITAILSMTLPGCVVAGSGLVLTSVDNREHRSGAAESIELGVVL